MKKYVICGLTGFSLFSEYEEIEAKNPKEAIKKFMQKQKPEIKIKDIFYDGEQNRKNGKLEDVIYKFSVNIFKGYYMGNSNWAKRGKQGYYFITTTI